MARRKPTYLDYFNLLEVFKQFDVDFDINALLAHIVVFA